ncbi:MAG: cation:proton antiporter [Gemmatimonadota bacterium]|nr:cation:proton antiporter [Gemmatimonadota bacterium]
MHVPPVLRDLVVLVGIAIPVVALASRWRVPTIVGFLVTGMAIGPFGFGLIRDITSVAELAEIGVVLLLFSIGLELSLSRTLRLGRVLVIGGTLQVGVTLAATAAIAIALGAAPARAVVYGALAALSSTAIVLKVYSDRGALDQPDGRIVVPILVFQDLAIIPLVLIVESLGGIGGPGGDMLVRIGGSLLAVAVIVFGGRVIVPRVLAAVAAVRSRELFTLSIVFMGVGAAVAGALAGLSLALGAFLAGLIISESDYASQALADVIPFRDTFSGLFFASVGMLLDLRAVAANPLPILLLAAAIVVGKTVIATGAAMAVRRPLHVSLVSGIGLAQVGEFSFILATIAAPLGLLPPVQYQMFLGAAILTMMAAPFLLRGAPALAARVVPPPPLDPDDGEASDALTNHVIMVGYGISGRNLARVLDGAGIPYVILEQNIETVRQAREELQPIRFGDATRAEVLERAGIHRARAIVFAISSPSEELRGAAVARSLSATVHIVVRTRYVGAMEDLRRAGASEVVPEEFETSLEIFSRVLRHFEIPSNVIAREVEAARVELYGMALGTAAGESQLEALAQLGIHHTLEIVQVEPDAPAVGKSPVTLHLRHVTGATVIAVVRAGSVLHNPDPSHRFDVGDSVVLVGDDDALLAARALFVAPPPADPPT